MAGVQRPRQEEPAKMTTEQQPNATVAVTSVVNRQNRMQNPQVNRIQNNQNLNRTFRPQRKRQCPHHVGATNVFRV
jgi:hypothetical protein